ncbi:hypothetical protein INT43_004877 [Umbelopsis isabellina]|uniref:Uncharacterized protein n=1 Tax=Mortierella isabellina TaxID=91625 RepID=A0A8H7PEA5_MORIS|nr:hypothetical protein INT43_004877 [Umbelopsis isabellina]
MNLEKDAFAGLVTSMVFLTDSILLVGQGPWLKFFDVRTGILLEKSLVLPSNRIHRLVIEPVTKCAVGSGIQTSRILAYGAKYLAQLEIEYEVSDEERGLDHKKVDGAERVCVKNMERYGPFKDWIQDAQWIFENETRQQPAKEIAIAFAHNYVEIYDITTGTPTKNWYIQCEEQCILYSARFFGHTRETLVLGAGTVFNEVHVWKVMEKNEEGFAPVHHRLVGHDGVIFGIRFDDDGQFLVSVSDDRTMRIWSLKNDQRKCHVIFGHTARIWDCHIVNRYLVSVSEDTTCRVWNNPYLVQDEEGGAEASMDCLACWEGHTGKNVWSCAVSPNKQLVATGGQDSGVRLWSLKSIQENHIESDADLTMTDLPELTTYSPPMEKPNEFIRNFVLVDYDQFAVFTNLGYLLRYDNTNGQWTKLLQDDDFRNYAIMKACTSGKLIVSGNLQGRISIAHANSEFQPMKIKLCECKILNIFVSESKVAGVFYIVTLGVEGEMFLHQLDRRHTVEPEIKLLHRLQPSNLKTTVICTAICEDYNLLVCGSRESALLIYRIPALASQATDNDPVSPVVQLRRTHGRQAVSSVTLQSLPETTAHGPGLTLITTGRDGCYTEYRLTNINTSGDHESSLDMNADEMDVIDDHNSEEHQISEQQHIVIEKVYKNRVTKGWAEGAMYMDGQLYILGFYRKRFIVFNVAKGYEMLSIACGGAHRTWHFINQDAKLARCTFAFFRRNKVNALYRKASTSKEVFEESIQSNFHGRDVRAIKFAGKAVALKESFKQLPLIVATGAEDTLLRLSQYVSGQHEGKIVNLRTVRKHSSVIKSINWSIGRETLLFTSGASEELRCWKVDSHPPQGIPASAFDPSRHLLDISCLEWAASPMVSDIKETRIMDTSAFPIDASRGLHILAAAYSDSTTRLWLFDETAKKFFLVADGIWHMKCLLQITHFLVPDRPGGEGVVIVTTATDGKLAFWDATRVISDFINSYKTGTVPSHSKLPTPFYHYQAHLSGVNALDIQSLDDGSLIVASGGEDNALAVNWISITYSDHQSPQASVNAKGDIAKIASAHASSVTGVHIVGKLILTVSTDQRLNVWEVNTDQGLTISMHDAYYIDVPDPSAMDLIIQNGILYVGIAGIGFQLLKTRIST